MNNTFSLIKNIILVIASALTLIAVTFAWFSSDNQDMIGQMSHHVIEADKLISVDFYEEKSESLYEQFNGDITLDGCVPGEYNKYKLLVHTNTKENIGLTISIDNLPETFQNDLDDYVCIKYSLVETEKNESGVVYDKNVISESNGYAPISDLKDGVICGVSLKEYQDSDHDTYAIYYEIGLAENTPSSVQGISSDLGSLSVSATEMS